MRIHYNVTGRERKALVNVVAEITGAQPVYKGMPTAAYEVDRYTVTKDGALEFSDRSDSEEVEAVLAALAEAGFEGAGETNGDQRESEEPAEPSGESPEDGMADGLTISLPLDGMGPDAIDRLTKLIDSKAALIRKALGAERLSIQQNDGKLSFPWWDRLPGGEETAAYTAFIAALCRMAKDAKRVTATEKAVDSEKYAFRGFLLRLGFIGASCKAQRKLLLKNLSGSAAFPNREKADAFSFAQKAKRDAAKAAREEATA